MGAWQRAGRKMGTACMETGAGTNPGTAAGHGTLYRTDSRQMQGTDRGPERPIPLKMVWEQPGAGRTWAMRALVRMGQRIPPSILYLPGTYYYQTMCWAPITRLGI